MTGRELGQYRIEDQLGAGGMGVVYRARNLRNQRLVALKTMSGSALSDAERRARFQREAQLASSLHHPNIISIFDIGSGQIDGQTVDYIAMELVDGRTLDQIIQVSPVPETRAVNLGIQIASGLAAAHAAGVVHRDLKPSNVIVDADDKVRILDFGLAKMAGALQQATAYGATQSVQLGLTVDGTIMGSVAYMSPEQAEGKQIDARADIFAFGSVMYEMLSGRQAFPGDSQVGSLSAVLLKDPEPLTPSQASDGLRSLISKCLRKDPEKRWQSMADIRLTLEELRDEAPAKSAAAARTTATTRRGWLMAAGGLLAGLAPAAYFATRRHPQATFERLTFRRGDIWAARFGQHSEIYYTAHWDGSPLATYLSIPGSREARDIGLPRGKMLSLNSNAEALVLEGDDSLASGAASVDIGKLVRAGISGGAPKELLDDVEDAEWAPNGSSMAVVRRVGNQHRLEFPVGTVLYGSDLRPPLRMRIHPTNSSVAFFGYDAEIGDFAVTVVDSNTKPRILSRGWRTAGGLSWSPDGNEVWFSAAKPSQRPGIFAVDAKGTERALLEPPGFMLLHDVRANGDLLAASMDSKITIRCLGSLDSEERDLGWMDASRAYDISDDGSIVLFMELAYGEGRNTAIYIRKTDGGQAVKIGYGVRPSLSPDGKWIACIVREDQTTALRIYPAGAGEERTLRSTGLKYETVSWFPDQKRLLVSASQEGKPVRSYIRTLDSELVEPVTPEGVKVVRLSPDGRTAVTVEGGIIRIRPIQAGEMARDIGPIGPGDQIVNWTSDGRGLQVARPVSGGVDLYRLDLPSKQYSKLREVHYPEDNAEFYSIVVSPNTKWYALSYQKDLGELYLVRGVGG